MKHHHFEWEKLTISMAIFNSYVKLPEGKSEMNGTTSINGGEKWENHL
jgi:hypothetical protein